MFEDMSSVRREIREFTSEAPTIDTNRTVGLCYIPTTTFPPQQWVQPNQFPDPKETIRKFGQLQTLYEAATTVKPVVRFQETFTVTVELEEESLIYQVAADNLLEAAQKFRDSGLPGKVASIEADGCEVLV